MVEKGKKVLKSPYHMCLWILILSLVFCGLVEWGYMTGAITKGNKPAAFGQWKIWLGVIPYCMWLVMTYIATRPKWFVEKYNVAEMYKVHRMVGLCSVILVCLHWFFYFGKAANKPIGWWTAYIGLVAVILACAIAVVYLTPWFKRTSQSLSRKTAIWLHRLNLVAIIAICVHAQIFRIGNFAPFYIALDVVTAVVVIYYLYWMINKK